MPELRQNIATKEWVIIASERAKRPTTLDRPIDTLGLGANTPINTGNARPFRGHPAAPRGRGT